MIQSPRCDHAWLLMDEQGYAELRQSVSDPFMTCGQAVQICGTRTNERLQYWRQAGAVSLVRIIKSGDGCGFGPLAPPVAFERDAHCSGCGVKMAVR